MNDVAIYFSTISKNQYLTAKERLESNLKQKTLAYTYVDREISQNVFDHYKNTPYEESVGIFLKRKAFTVLAILDSFLELITQVFLAIIEPTQTNWYSAGKDGEIVIGQMIRLFNDPRGLYWIDLARFDKDCYKNHPIVSDPILSTKKQLVELTPNKTINISKEKQIANKLKKALKDLQSVTETCETKHLIQRIQRRIIYTSTQNNEQKNAQVNLIQQEPDDEIKTHFFSLFPISTTVTVN